jgi:AraC family transcriptional regulator
MPNTLYHETLYRNDQLSVAAVRCRPRDCGCGGEEISERAGFAFVRRGAFVKHVGRREVLADPNQVVFFNPREPYRVSHPVEGGDDCLSIQFSDEGLRAAAPTSLLRRLDSRECCFERQTRPVAATLQLRQQALRRVLRANGCCEDLHLDEIVQQLVECVLNDEGTALHGSLNQRAGTRCAHRELAARVQGVLATRYSEPLPLRMLAREVHISPCHLSRVFQREMGMPIHVYRLQLRLRTALEALAEGERDTTGLALRVGFSSRGHFSDSFRRVFGLSIQQFRRTATVPRFRDLSKNLGAACS